MSERIFADHARAYQAKGLPVIPFKPQEKRPSITNWAQYSDHMPSTQLYDDWFNKKGNHGIGLVMGSELAPNAKAACAFCDKVVKLDSELAACFTKDEESLVEKFKTSKRAFVSINLGQCTKAKGSSRSIIVGTDATRKAPLKSNFILDRPSFDCLIDAIKSHEGKFDPRLVVDLRKNCV